MKRATPREIVRLLNRTPLILMFDIDGTLCEIVEHAGDARIPSVAQAALRTLSGRSGHGTHVAFVTGRSAVDARRMVAVGGAVIYGNHGMERMSAAGTLDTSRGSETESSELREAVRELASVVAAFSGTSLEDKGLSLTLHFRAMDIAQLPDLNSRVANIADRLALRLAQGKCVINVLPAGGATKGDAVLEIVHEIAGHSAGASILFAGDDVTDEDGFRTLRKIPGSVTLRVGSPNATSLAQFSLDGPRDVHELLSLLVTARS